MSGADLFAVGGARGRPVDNAVWGLDRKAAGVRPSVWRDHVLEARFLASQLADESHGLEVLDVYVQVLTARRDGLSIARAETAFALETARRCEVQEAEWLSAARRAAERAGVEVAAVLNPMGKHCLSRLRNAVWFELYSLRNGSGGRVYGLSSLARRFGTDHTNVLHGLRRHCALHGFDPAVLA